jgi:hypothetical protein
MIRHYILNGHTPVEVTDLRTWMRWLVENTDDRHVAWTEFEGGHVSTVFLGLDHNWFGSPPLLFETMIFGGPEDGYCERYSTWDEADAGHTRACVIAMTPRDTSRRY